MIPLLFTIAAPAPAGGDGGGTRTNMRRTNVGLRRPIVIDEPYRDTDEDALIVLDDWVT